MESDETVGIIGSRSQIDHGKQDASEIAAHTIATAGLTTSLKCRHVEAYYAARQINWRNQAWLLKNSLIGTSSWVSVPLLALSYSSQLRGGRQDRRWRLAEEAHQTLDVLRRRCQEELLPHKFQSPQAQAT
jgi:hypothetical protein